MDHLLPWLPALTTTGMLALALWLGRTLIANRLNRSVEFEFNARLAELRRDLTASEERLKEALINQVDCDDLPE